MNWRQIETVRIVADGGWIEGEKTDENRNWPVLSGGHNSGLSDG